MDKSQFCPFVKDICKTDICIGWNGSECSVIAFYKHFLSLNHTGAEKKCDLRGQIIAEEEMAHQLLPECLDWAQSKKITRPTREEIRTFLIIKNVMLGEAAMRLLWRQAKAKLRESRRESSGSWRDNSSNFGLAWSADEDEALLTGFDLGENILELVKSHKRSRRAIELRLEKFGKIQLPKQLNLP